MDESALEVLVDRIDHAMGNWQKDMKVVVLVKYSKNAACQSYHGNEVMVEC